MFKESCISTWKRATKSWSNAERDISVVMASGNMPEWQVGDRTEEVRDKCKYR